MRKEGSNERRWEKKESENKQIRALIRTDERDQTKASWWSTGCTRKKLSSVSVKERKAWDNTGSTHRCNGTWLMDSEEGVVDPTNENGEREKEWMKREPKNECRTWEKIQILISCIPNSKPLCSCSKNREKNLQKLPKKHKTVRGVFCPRKQIIISHKNQREIST